MLLDEGTELPGGEPVAEQVGCGHDRGGTRALVDERDLPEIVSGPERRTGLAADADRRVPLDDDEEPGSTGALGRHFGAFPEAPLFHLAPEALEVVVAEAREDRDLTESIRRSRRHAARIIREKVRTRKRRTHRTMRT